MAINTPQLYSINAFDPAYEYIINFTYTGTQVVSNRAIITDNETQEEVYNVKQDGLKTNHVLPADTLEAGHSYLIQIQVYDKNGDSSDLSGAVLFYCYTTPQLYFLNINNGDIISAANYELKLSYIQPENEQLDEYRYYLYDMTRELVYTSDSYYTESGMSHSIYGLKNDNVYYVRAIGKTTHGMNVDTGMIQFSASYISVASNMVFEAINDRDTGCIVLKTNIVTVDYELSNENYSIENGIVDLTDNTLNYFVKVDGDFSLVIKARQLLAGKFLWSTDENISVRLVDISGKYYVHLFVYGAMDYNIYKPLEVNYRLDDTKKYMSFIDAEENEALIAFEIYRKNNLYDINIKYE